jgi:phage shock protein C
MAAPGTRVPGDVFSDRGWMMSESARNAGSRRLYRSRDDRMIAGVCGGLASYFSIDPTIVRVIAVATILLPGPSVIVYLVLWLIVPEEPAAPTGPIEVDGR